MPGSTRVAAISDSDDSVSFTTAQACLRIGQLQRQLDQPVRKREAYEKAVAILERLVKEHPGSAEFRLQLALACRALATDPAERRSIELLEGLAADFPDVPDYRLELGEGCRAIGDKASLARAHETARHCTYNTR